MPMPGLRAHHVGLSQAAAQAYSLGSLVPCLTDLFDRTYLSHCGCEAQHTLQPYYAPTSSLAWC